MADWNKPDLTDTYANFLSLLKDRDFDAISLGLNTITNPVTGMIRYLRASNKFQEWDGATWIDKVLSIAGGGTGANSAPGVIAALGLGTMAFQAASAVAIVGGTISNLGSLAVNGAASVVGNLTVGGIIIAGSGVVALTDATGIINAAALPINGIIPAGAFMGWAGNTAPTGWLLCDGTAVSRATYAALFASISTTYGPGNGTTTFNLPDYRGRVLIGAGTGTGLTARTRGSNYGAETVVLTTPNLPSHFHTIVDPGHFHQALVAQPSGITQLALGYDFAAGAIYEDQNDRGTPLTLANTTGINATQGAGGDVAHDNVQPSLAANVIIKT